MPDLDPQEVLEQDYDPSTDITTDEEAALPLEPEDDGYTPEPLDPSVTAFDVDGWPGDELVIADLDGIDEDEEETD